MTTQLLPIVHQLDITGVNPNNKVSNEPHILDDRKVRAIAPIHCPIFKDNLIIKDNANNRILSASEYKLYSIQAVASALYGKELYNIILILNPLVSPSVSITYQTLGGEYSRTNSSIKDMIDKLYDDNRPVTWYNVVDEPATFNPVHHLHSVGDIIGFEYVVAALERLRTAIITANSLSSDRILKYLDNRLQPISNLNTTLQTSLDQIDALANDFVDHISNLNNPHQTDKIQVGLSNLENYSISTKNELDNPNNNDPKYVTNNILKQYIQEQLVIYSTYSNSQISLLQNDVNVINNKVNLAYDACLNLVNTQAIANQLDSNYTNLLNQLNTIQTNLTDSQNRAANNLSQYLNNGI